MMRASDHARLLPGAPEAITAQAVYVVGVGWHLTLSVRRQFQEWSEASRGSYEYLTTPELMQVIEDELGVELGV